MACPWLGCELDVICNAMVSRTPKCEFWDATETLGDTPVTLWVRRHGIMNSTAYWIHLHAAHSMGYNNSVTTRRSFAVVVDVEVLFWFVKVFSKDKFVGQALDIPLFFLQAFSCYSLG